MSHKLSCTVIAMNEEDRIERCLASVRGIVDEIVVVDSGSTDRTLEIARACGAVCHVNAWRGYGQQKRFAEDVAANDWILNLDADEWLTDAARQEIAAIMGSPQPDPEIHGYRFDIRHVYPGRSKPRLLADSHKYVRLYDKTHCRFPDSAVFDEIKLDARNTGRIRGAVLHQSLRSLSHLMKKNVAYYRLQTTEIDKAPSLLLLRMVTEPFTVFFKYYVLKRHFTGGAYGLAVASTIAGLRTYRLALLRRNGKSRASG